MSKTILVIEDDKLHAKMFTTLLQEAGYETVHSKDGGAVMGLVREHRPDLIVMDIQLPGISGLEITRMLKADDDLKTIPVIAVTAIAMPGDRERMLEGGCNDYISKPISIVNFVETVKKHLA